MTYWLVPSNEKIFRLNDIIRDKGETYWAQRNNFELGDHIFIMNISSNSHITFELEVSAVDKDDFEDEEFYNYWVDVNALGIAINNHRFCHLLKIRSIDNVTIDMAFLRAHSFKGNLQSPIKINDYLLTAILQAVNGETVIEGDERINPEFIDDNEQFFEGAVMQVKVNKYERNREARENCIKFHGSKCAVCGLDFNRMYGEIGKGFIHVHHLIPISTISKEYQIDPINDLIPVCPNCHSMLHRGPNGTVITPSELKDIISAQSSINDGIEPDNF